MQTSFDRVPLGATGIQISPMGIGTWAWGNTWFWQYGKGGYSDADLNTAYQASLAHGITFFDTAEMYGRGRSEQLLGQFARKAGWPVVITTKFFPLPWRVSKGQLSHALHHSLDRLGLESVDLYQMHWPFPPVPMDASMSTIANAVQAGLIHAVGVSNYSAQQTRRAYDTLARRGVPLASNQVNYSLLQRKPETNGLLALCKQLNVTLIASSPLAQGLLTGKYTPENPPPGLRGRRYGRDVGQDPAPHRPAPRISPAHGGKTPAQVALNWTISKGTVPILAPKAPSGYRQRRRARLAVGRG